MTQRAVQLYQQAASKLPGGVSSNVRLAEKPRPAYFQKSYGARTVDVDGRAFIDYVCGYGPIVLGHNPQSVVDRVMAAIQEGQLYGGSHPLELELAERMIRAVPSLEMVRFNCSGSEAVHAALRLARAYTNRRKIIRFEGHYHGWFDGQIIGYQAPVGEAPSPAGQAHLVESTGIPQSVLEDLVVVPWNDAEILEAAFKRHAGEIAGVIMEPIMGNSGCIEPDPGYLEKVRSLCDEHGTVLIFDEIITGFRVGLGGAQGLYDIDPDLSVFGKAMAAGFPISAIGGKEKIMKLIVEGRALHAGTYNGNVACVAAACATMEALENQSESVYNHMRTVGRALMDGLVREAQAAGIALLAQGPGPVFWVWFTEQPRIRNYRDHVKADFERYNAFHVGMAERGIRIMPGGRWYVSAAHTMDDVDETLRAARSCFEAIASS